MAAQIADAGIYDLRGHHDDVVQPLLRHWRVFEREGLDDAAEQRRDQLATELAALDEAARRFEEKREAPDRPAHPASPS
jgi:acyl-[acyl-carrier-protein] desaturase